MRWRYHVRRLSQVGVWLAAATFPAAVFASDRIKGVRDFNPHDETVELFSAIESGKLEARLIPKGSSQCRLLITNRGEEPLNVTLPAALAGTPVLAQFQDANLFDNANNANNAPQRIGIGNPFGNDPMRNRANLLLNVPGRRDNLGPDFAPFNIAPEKVAQLKLTSVCLDHGKPNPRPAIPYRLEPISSVTENSEVHQLCRALGRGEISQRAAQAAAWHFNNGMSWEELAGLRLQIALGRITQPFFTSSELAEAEKAADEITRSLAEREQRGKIDSLSQR